MSKRSFILYFDFLYYFERNGKQISPMAIWSMSFLIFLFFEFGISLVAYSICHYTRIPLPHFNFFRLQLFSKGLGFKKSKIS